MFFRFALKTNLNKIIQFNRGCLVEVENAREDLRIIL